MGDAKQAKPWVFGVVIGVVLIAGLGFGLHVFSGVSETRPAPDFTLETVQHGNFTLSEHRGSVVVIDLMAVDCATCRVTEQSLLQLNETYPDVQIVSVDIWVEFEDEEYLDGHMKQLGADWPYAMDTDDMLLKYRAFEISKVAVVDANGYLSGEASGAIGFDRLEGLVVEAQESESMEGAALGEIAPSLPIGLAGFALLAGIASFFAPCAFPLLPGYMAYTLSIQSPAKASQDPAIETEQRKPRFRDALIPGFAAAGGILLIYGLFGLIVAGLGESARPWLPLLQPGVGVLAIILGVALLLGATMDRIIRPLQRGVDRFVTLITRKNKPGTLTGYFSYGLGYGAAAAGCTAPVFLTLIVTAFLLGFATGVRIFLIYAGTAAVLMIVATLVAVKARGLLQEKSAQIVAIANKISGVVLLGAGGYLIWFYHRSFGLPFIG